MKSCFSHILPFVPIAVDVDGKEEGKLGVVGREFGM